MTYSSELNRAMRLLAAHPKTLFMGQCVAMPGIRMSATFEGVPPAKLLEFPVAEDMQLGTAIGMALEGYIPVCVFPRWNFLLCAANQLVNHLDKLPTYSAGGYAPKVIIRVGAARPGGRFTPGPQHDGDFTDAFRMMLKSVEVMKLGDERSIVPSYQMALARSGSTLLVEYT